MITLSSAAKVAAAGGRTTRRPPDRPLPTKSLASPSSVSVMPEGTNAPKLWPAAPVNVTRMVSVGSPRPPKRRVTSEPSSVPAVRSVLRMGSAISTGACDSSAAVAMLIRR